MNLQKAGKGLPNFERLFIKNILVPTVRTFFTWDLALFLVKNEAKKIEKLVNSVPKEYLNKQIIINRAFAIEDHSRQFSINMVCEHLCIAGMGVASIIKTLSKEKKPKKDITIEEVKPKNNDDNSLQNFLNFMLMYEKMIKNLNKKQSNTKQKHPWFVEFNNYDWSVFMYMHTFIHRRQIQEIIRVLKKDSNV